MPISWNELRQNAIATFY